MNDTKQETYGDVMAKIEQCSTRKEVLAILAKYLGYRNSGLALLGAAKLCELYEKEDESSRPGA